MTRATYGPVPAHIDVVASEHDILAYWDHRNIFQKSLDQAADSPNWTVFEGPPTANGTPGTHHIEARTLKDLLPRYKSMRGSLVARKAGWDCHGLPVEIAVEKELGFNGKPDIESYGIAQFNDKCRASVTRHVDQWQDLTRRMGYWVDLDHPYRTMDRSYIESVWWSLKRVHEQGLLEEDYRVAPYCPRCGTALSDHELAQGYESVTDRSAYVRFPVVPAFGGEKVSLLAWTTTPWTLPSNTAIAVNPIGEYVVSSDGQESLILERSAAARLLDARWQIVQTVTGSELLGLRYEAPFDIVPFPENAQLHTVVPATYVTAETGTGLVHIAPAFGAEDLEVARENNLPVVNVVSADGRFDEALDLIGGLFFHDADAVVLEEIAKAGRLYGSEDLLHQYPHCWRCHTRLMYYALPSWYIRTTQIRDQMVEENERTNWIPGSVKEGRFGEWLRGNVDWALSRSRYWGTPLPVWRNDATGAIVVVESMRELASFAGRDLSSVDPHRPFIDDVTFTKDGEPGVYRRVPDVIDAWYDSGAMPFAQWGYPHVEGSKEQFAKFFPAQFISEAIDQTRGWFYSLMAVSTAVFGRGAYENVVALGHILADDGRKMSKHLGNIILPLPLMDTHGADTVRWFMACSGAPAASRLVNDSSLEEITRKITRTLWSAASFQALYADAAGWSPTAAFSVPSTRPVLDRWILGEANRLVRDVQTYLDEFDTQRAGALISDFLDSLSNWYIRRSRRRFWEGDESALASLHEALKIVTLVMAPFMPFITERVWLSLFGGVDTEAEESVHLASWPSVDTALIDDELALKVKAARKTAEVGRAARKAANQKIRQPLRRALVSSDLYALLDRELRDDVAAELNVLEIASFEDAGFILNHVVKPDFRALGKLFGPETQNVAGALRAMDATEALGQLNSRGAISVTVGSHVFEIPAETVTISEQPREGWAVQSSRGSMLALDLEIDAELRRAGVARDVIRAIQGARKDAGLDVSDRIDLTWNASGEVETAILEHAARIAREVLAVSVRKSDDSCRLALPDVEFSFDLRVAGA